MKINNYDKAILESGIQTIEEFRNSIYSLDMMNIEIEDKIKEILERK